MLSIFFISSPLCSRRVSNLNFIVPLSSLLRSRIYVSYFVASNLKLRDVCSLFGTRVILFYLEILRGSLPFLPPDQLLSIRVSSGSLRQTISFGKMHSSSVFRSARFVPSTLFVLASVRSTHFFDSPFTAAHFLSVHVLPRALRCTTPCLDFSQDFSNHPSRFCPSSSSLFTSYLYRHPCLYLISTLRSRSIFILPLHALFRHPSRPPIHPRSSTFSISRRLASTITLSVSPLHHRPFPSRLNRRECLSSISLFAPRPLPSTLFSLSIYHSSRALYPSRSLSFPPDYLPPTHMHPPPSSSAGSVRIGPAR